MKKVLSVVVAMLLCMSLVMPAFAAEDIGFVPSITYKPAPEIVPVYDENGNPYVAVIKDGEGNIIDLVEAGCLIVTPIAHVWDEEIEVPQEIEELLLYLYTSLNDGSMEIPYEKHEANLVPDNMAIRDLFDARWGCEEHPKMLAPKGVVLELTFDLGIMPDVEVFVQSYDEATGIWEPIVSAVNNGDGTLTCVFEHLCGIEFSVEIERTEKKASFNELPWVIVLILAAVAVVGILVAKKKKNVAE